MSSARDVYQVMNKTAPARGGGPMGRGPVGRGPVVADRNTRSTVHFIPDTAACEGTTKVTLVFDEFPDSLGSGNGAQVEVSVRSKEKIDRIVATQINRRTFSFTAPDNREGDASAVVFVNGTEVASSYLRYRSEAVHLVAGLSQIYLQFLSTICRYMYTLQTKHQIQSPMPELDRLLAETFEDKDNKHNIPVKAFEELFDILRHSSTDVVESKYEFPTLLHLTGEYGLEQLAVRLLDLPGATRASNVLNLNKRTATELARNNGHQMVAKTLGTSNKTKSSSVEARIPSTPSARGKNVNTMLPSNPRSGHKPSADGDYMLPDDKTSVDDFEDNYAIFSQQQQQQPSSMGGSTPRKQPPAPCQKFTQSKSVPSITPESLPTILPRSSVGTAAPPVPRRESRDSGVHGDGIDAPPGPLPRPARQRPPLTKGETEPAFVYNEEGHYVPNRKSSQDATGNTVQRNLSLSGEEIARQLKKPVHPQPGTRGPSVTK